MKKTKSSKEKPVPPVEKVDDQNDLISTSIYPYAHWKFEKFNPVQSRIMDFYNQDANCIIAAATSSGKTVIAEQFMADEIRRKGGKAMFLCPLRALAREKMNDWTNKNHHFSDLKISICTGDYRLTKERTKELAEANIIIMTSEMLNHRSRNFKSEKNNFLLDVQTLVVDEFHLLTVPGRGDHLETGMMKFTEINKTARIVLLSATMPNVDQIADWVSYSLTKKRTVLLNSKYRPVPLTVHYESYDDESHRYDALEEEKINKALDIVEWYKNDKFLIFTHTKRTGEKMKIALKEVGINAEFHNADLEGDKRAEVEDRFRNDPSLRIMIATSTVAWGCYAKETPVLMANDTIKKIEDICIGDHVYGMTDQGFQPFPVTMVGPKQVENSLRFELVSGESVVVSANHKFYGVTERNVPDYYEASKFGVGDYIAVPAEFPQKEIIPADDLGYVFGCNLLCTKDLNLINIPRFDKSFIKGLIQGLFDTSSIFTHDDKDNKILQFTTTSSFFAAQLQQYLLFFGVRGMVVNEKSESKIIICEEQQENFLRFVGFRTTKINEEAEKNLLIKTNKKSNSTNEFVYQEYQESKNIRFSKIKKIEFVGSQQMFDIAVDSVQNYVGGGVVSHNCNFPARRVIILGVHRGLQEVESYDILQMVGRSGRLGIDPAGDAYVLVPESQSDMYRAKYSKPRKIESQLLEKVGERYKSLAFHLVSEIHHGDVETTSDVIAWYKRSFGYFQNKEIDETIVTSVLESLKKCGAVWCEDDKWTCRPIGKVSSMFYFSPYDVSELFYNFKNLFEGNYQNDDYQLAVALANIDSHRMNIVSKIEKEEIHAFAQKVYLLGLRKNVNDPAMKIAYCYHNLLNGRNSQTLAAQQRSLQSDFMRVSQVLQALDSFTTAFKKDGFFKTLEGRIINGVPAYLVNLCQIPNIGKVRAKKLYDHGIKTTADLCKLSETELKSLLNMKKDLVAEVLSQAKKLH
jgi:replicative superfamily II helicase